MPRLALNHGIQMRPSIKVFNYFLPARPTKKYFLRTKNCGSRSPMFFAGVRSLINHINPFLCVKEKS